MTVTPGRMIVIVLGLGMVAPASAQDKNPPGVNPQHYQCYSVTEPKPSRPHEVVLRDQFGESETTTAKPVLLCNPVSKNKEEVRDKETHLVCYEIRPHKSVEKRVEVQNQFGMELLSVGTPRILCVPSLKRILD